MTLQFWFWILMVLWLLFGFWSEYVPGQAYPFNRGGRHFLNFILFAILGWQVFGSPVR